MPEAAPGGSCWAIGPECILISPGAAPRAPAIAARAMSKAGARSSSGKNVGSFSYP